MLAANIVRQLDYAVEHRPQLGWNHICSAVTHSSDTSRDIVYALRDLLEEDGKASNARFAQSGEVPVLC
jgi:hypothetical protein